MDIYLSFLLLILVSDVIFLTIMVIGEWGNPYRMLGYTFFILGLPFLGFFFYLVIGQTAYNGYRQKEFGDDAENLASLAHIKFDDISDEPDEAHRQVFERMRELGGVGYSRDNEIKLYTVGQPKFEDIFADMRAAKKFIFLEYYIIKDDFMGKTLLDILTEKAKEGLEVKLMVDDFNFGKKPKSDFNEFIAAGGEFVIFHMLWKKFFSPRKNNRNHRKVAYIDGEIAYVSGFNFGKGYVGLSWKGYWRDSAVRIRGNAVIPLGVRFCTDWEYMTGRKIERDEFHFKRTEEKPGEHSAMIFSGGPNLDVNPIVSEYLELIRMSKETLYIHSPYFNPTEEIKDALKDAAKRGVDVRIIIPNIADHVFVYWNNIRTADELMTSGVRYFRYTKGFVHSKTVVTDSEYCSVGSANFNPRSINLDFETNVFIASKDFGKQMYDAFLEDLEDCYEYTPEMYQKDRKENGLRLWIARMFAYFV